MCCCRTADRVGGVVFVVLVQVLVLQERVAKDYIHNRGSKQ